MTFPVRFYQPKMAERIHVTGSSDVMRLIDEDELEARRVKLGDTMSRRETSHGCDGDICKSTGMEVSHFNLNGFGGVRVGAVPGCLFDQLSAVNKYERLRRAILPWLDTVDELGEDYLWWHVVRVPIDM